MSVGGALVRTLARIWPSTRDPRVCIHCDQLSADRPGGAEAGDVRVLTTTRQA